MRFLTPFECEPIFASTHLTVSEAGHLITRKSAPPEIMRLAGGPARDVGRLAYFVETLIRWLPPNRGRLLWISDWAGGIGNALEAMRAIRLGLGETRDLADAPAFYLGPHSWIWDQVEMPRDQARESEILVGMLFIVMGCGWDGWLASEDCGDTIEFWEGNVLFYSKSPEMIEKAAAIFRDFDCREKMV